MRYERPSLVFLRRAVGVDIVDVREVRLKPRNCSQHRVHGHENCRLSLFFGQGDNVVDIEQLLPPPVQIRWIGDDLQVPKMPRCCPPILICYRAQVDLILQSSQGFMVNLWLVWELRMGGEDTKLACIAKVAAELVRRAYIGGELGNSRLWNRRSLIKG